MTKPWLTLVLALAITSIALAAPPPTSQSPKVERKGPVATMPSAPGPHIEKIKAMAGDSWLELGQAAPDPKWGHGRGRAWCAQMDYAPELRGAFHTGEGVHAFVKPDGYYMDDIFFYDINAHAWVCIYPGAKAGEDQGLKLNDAGFFVNAAGDLVMVAQLAHHYGGTTYDTDQRKFVVMTNQFIRNWWSPSKLPQLEKLVPEARAKQTGKSFSPWYWNTVTGKFEREPAQGASEKDLDGHGCVTAYLPGLKTIFFRGANGVNWLYDPAKKVWTKAAKGPVGNIGHDMTACYDGKRQRVYVPTGMNKDVTPALYAYDAREDKWLDLQPKGGGKSTDVNRSCLTYDAVNDVVVLAQRGPDNRGLFIYDPATNAWLNEQPKTPPAGWGKACVSAFYDPENNVHYYYDAGDSSTRGTFWVYRYKRAVR